MAYLTQTDDVALRLVPVRVNYKTLELGLDLTTELTLAFIQVLAS